jgi:hypothetical protein
MTTGGCSWTAASNDSFITINDGASGSGNGTVSYTVAANPDPTPRTGSITIAGQTFTVAQAAAASCSFTLSQQFQSPTFPAGTGSVDVTTQDGCAWSAVSNASFLTVTSGASGTGSGTVTFSYTANRHHRARVGTITIGDAIHLVVGQNGNMPFSFVSGTIGPQVASFTPGSGLWHIANQDDRQWGLPGDVPVPGDYDADGTTEVAVYRPSNGVWFIRNGATVQWGLPASGEVPAPAG